MMAEGERQVSPTLDGIRRDHVARYQWAAKYLREHAQRDQISVQEIQDPEPRMIDGPVRVIDFACGVGYGTRVLADAGHTTTGYDIDEEAIAYADEHYCTFVGPGADANFRIANGNAPGELDEYDAAVCFETIEHIEDPRPLLMALRKSVPMLLASVPNEAVMPWRRADGATTMFHFRHYTKGEFNALLLECGWRATEWYGQEGPESEVEPEVNGRTLIAVCERCEPIMIEPAGKHIAILGLGPSLEQYSDLVKRLGGRSKFCDEVWAINALGDVFACDLVFHMDDVRIQEIRAAAAPASNIAAMLSWLKKSKVPVVTSRAHPDYPALVEYPLEDVLNHLQYDYFNSTAAYAVAFAIHIGAAKISVFGMDFSYENTHQAEKGRACVEYWLGQAQARGIKLAVPKNSTLLDARHSRAERLYGYDCVNVKFNMQADGTVKLDMVPKETLPTAEAIEKQYDHTAPIAEQHLTKE